VAYFISGTIGAVFGKLNAETMIRAFMLTDDVSLHH
jgi:hypothetical protein